MSGWRLPFKPAEAALGTAVADFRFPVVGFTPDHEIWGFPSLDALTACGPATLAKDMQGWLFRSLLSTPQYRIDHDLEPMPPVSLEELKARAAFSTETFSRDYCAEDEREEVLEPLLRDVAAAKTVTEIHRLLGLDTFQDY